jgi:hypothetical protein
VISAALGATSLFYAVLDNAWVTLIGVLLTFALLVQFASVLSDVERTPGVLEERGWLRTFVANPRRLVESLVDFALITASFAFAYYLRLQGSGTSYDRHIFQVSLAVLLAARYLAFIPFGLYRGVWRYAGARDAAAIVAAVVVSEVVAYLILDATQVWGGFPRASSSSTRSSASCSSAPHASGSVLRARGLDVHRPRRAAAHADRRRRTRRDAVSCVSCAKRPASRLSGSWTTTRGSRGDGCRASRCSEACWRSRRCWPKSAPTRCW